MPQKDKFLINKLGFNIKHEYQLNEYSSYFYDLDFLYLNFDGYKAYQSVKNYNYKFTSGIKFYLYENLSLSLSGTIYKHNLLEVVPLHIALVITVGVVLKLLKYPLK